MMAAGLMSFEPGLRTGVRGEGEPGEEGSGREAAEAEGGDAEGLGWFFGQRAYPDGIPTGAFGRARAQAARLPLVGVNARGALSQAAAAPSLTTTAESSTATSPAGPSANLSSAALAAAATGGTGWVPLGPAPIGAQPATSAGQLSGFRQFSGPPPFAGRVTAIATHPTDSQIAYVGGAMGGVWKTTDGGANFAPVFDGQASLAVGAIGIDPLSPATVYVGTGEANATVQNAPRLRDSYYGTGLYKSTNAGATWAPIGGSTFGSCHIAGVQAHPTIAGVVVAAVTSSGLQGPTACVPGIFRSTDGGATWTRRLNTTIAAGGDFAALSIAVSRAAPTRWFAGVSKAGVYQSNDSGASWTRLTAAPLPPFTSVGRVAVSVSPVDPTRVYTVMSDRSGNALGVWTSGDGGTTWAAADSSGKPECTSSAGQCTYDLAIAASPGAPGSFTVGGVKLRRYTDFGTASSVVLDPQSAVNNAGVHWDIHVLAFDASGRMWIGTDGGVYRWDVITQPALNRNGTLGLTQFYPGISGTTSGLLIGGAQDMATNTTSGARSWRNQASGDGGYTVIDPTTRPATVLATTQSFGQDPAHGITASLYRSTDGGASFADINVAGISGEAREFITPMVAGTGNPLRIYAGLSRVYRSVDQGSTWSSISPTLLTGDTVTAIAQAPTDANVVWAATSTGRIFRTLDALAATPSWVSVNLDSDPVPYRFVTDIAIDPTNPDDVWVTLSGFNGTGPKQTGHVFRSTDAGIVWTDVSGNLPDGPANAIAILPSGTNRKVFLGTDVGVFASSNLGLTWARFQTGLPNVVVSDIRLDNPARRLIAATYGRGMFTACTGAVPAGDAFATPRVLAGVGSGSLAFTTTCASKEPGELSHAPDGNSGGASIWLRWTAPASGSVTLSTAGSTFDTVLGVYTGAAVGSLTEVVAPSDDVSATDLTSRLTFNATAGQTYLIAVDGFLRTGSALARNGTAKLTWSTA